MKFPDRIEVGTDIDGKPVYAELSMQGATLGPDTWFVALRARIGRDEITKLKLGEAARMFGKDSPEFRELERELS